MGPPDMMTELTDMNVEEVKGWDDDGGALSQQQPPSSTPSSSFEGNEEASPPPSSTPSPSFEGNEEASPPPSSTPSSSFEGNEEASLMDLAKADFFRFCVLTPKSMTACSAQIKHQTQATMCITLEHCSLEEFNLPFQSWMFQTQVQMEPRSGHKIKADILYQFTTGDGNKLIGFVTTIFNGITGKNSSKPKHEKRGGIPVRQATLQLDIVDHRGELVEGIQDVQTWMALLTKMIFFSDSSNVDACLEEYQHHHHHQQMMMIANRIKESDVDQFVNWAYKLWDWLRQGYAEMSQEENMNTAMQGKMCIFCLALTDLLKAFEMVYCRRDRLADVYLVLLSSLCEYEVELGASTPSPSFVEKTLADGVKNLVNCISSFSFAWIKWLSVLRKFEPTWQFCNRWNTIQFDIETIFECQRVEDEYGKAVTHLIHSSSSVEMSNKRVRSQISRVSLGAAPTLPAFLVAARALDGWMNNAADWDPTKENVQEEVTLSQKTAMEMWFNQLYKGPNGLKKANRLLKHFELALSVQFQVTKPSVAYLPPFLAARFRESFMHILLDIALSRPELLKKYSSHAAGDVKSLFQGAIKLICECPYTFTIPLLPNEVRLLSTLAGAESDEFHRLGKLALVKMAATFVELDPGGQKTIEQLRNNVLRPWILKAINRVKGSSQSQSSQVSAMDSLKSVDGLFDLGLDPSCLLAHSLSSLVVSVSQQKSPSMRLFLMDAEKIGQLHSPLQVHYQQAVVTMISAQLRCAEALSDVYQIGHEALEGICTQTPQGTLIIQKKMQEDLCVALLDAVDTTHQIILDDALDNEAIRTISKSDFAMSLMKIGDCPPRIQKHRIFSKVSEACMSLGSSLIEGTISMGTLNMISQMDNGATWHVIFTSRGFQNFVAALDAALRDLEVYKRRLRACDILVTIFCSFLSERGLLIQDFENWCKWLAERKENWGDFALSKVKLSDHWPDVAHASVFDNLDAILVLHQSRIFMNLLEESVQDLLNVDEICYLPSSMSSDHPHLVELGEESSSSSSSSSLLYPGSIHMVDASLIPRCMKTYKQELMPYVGRKGLDKVNMDRVCSLWHGVGSSQVETEFELARNQLDVTDTKGSWLMNLIRGKELDMVELIQAWVAIKAKGELAKALPRVAGIFGFEETCEGYLNKVEKLIKECEGGCTLKDFNELHKREGKAILAFVSEYEEFVLMRLAESEPLVMFLRENLDEDLRHLIDAIEEHSDHDFLQEAMISDLIDLHRLFRPLLKSETPSFKQLRKLITNEVYNSEAGASELAVKLLTCNENVNILRQILSTVANRGLKMRDHIKRILDGGQYHFTVYDMACHLRLSIGSHTTAAQKSDSDRALKEEKGVYVLADLQDFRSRARLVMSSHVMQARRLDIHSSGMSAADADSEEATKKFIHQVNIVEHLVTSISELHTSGHFQFAEYSNVVSGLENLQALERDVECELQDWYGAVKQARAKHPCLNYFRSMELRLFLEVLRRSPTEAIMEPKERTCLELLEWAGIKDGNLALRRAQAIAKTMLQKLIFPDGRHHHQEANKSYLLGCLDVIAFSLESAFVRRTVTNTVNPSEVVMTEHGFDELVEFSRKTRKHSSGSGLIILALVEDPQSELDAVVELFHRRGISLRDIPRNVLLCSMTTTWEEIHLLLLRCFKEDESQDSNSGFFCIAYVENLSFDCQSQFQSTLQEMIQEQEDNQPQNNIVIPNNIGDQKNVKFCEKLALVCCSKGHPLLALSRQLHVRVCHMGGANINNIQNQLPAECGNMRVVTSNLPGLGKTMFIHKTSPELVKTLCIQGSVSRNTLILRLKQLNLQPDSILHLNISTVQSSEVLNMLLFELLILGSLKSDTVGIFHLKTNHVFVELANTLLNELALSLLVCRWFKNDIMMWDWGMLEVSDDTNSNTQVVCIYLQQLDLRQPEIRDLIFEGPNRNVKALTSSQCQVLLKKYFTDHMKDPDSMTFAILDMFIKFFSLQLRNLTNNVFFNTENLKFMDAMPNIRSYLVCTLLEVSRDLSLRSVKPWLHEEQKSNGRRNTDLTMAARFDGMLRWSDSNHVMVFFQRDGPPSILYRDVDLVPSSMKQLFASQKLRSEERVMPNYSMMSSEELWASLWPILQREAPTYKPGYVLTPDNFLKMALIALRAEAGVPVIIMGETGCGKTSLLKNLALYCGVEFFCVTLHAGTSENEIRTFVAKVEAVAARGPKKVWAFLDEINACDHLGLLDGLICHRSMDGVPLHHELVLLAACNPYRLHDKESNRIGFSAQELLNPSNTQHFNLAYRVHPLPEAMLDYVWDFGLLSQDDEKAYILAMVREIKEPPVHLGAFTDLLVQSQDFLRQCHGEASVSLRDVSRCISLYCWFLENLKLRPLSTQKIVAIRATILAFSHCYHSRLATEHERQQYRDLFAAVVRISNPHIYKNFDGTQYEKMLRDEQMDLLNRMEIPAGIAKNKALLENVFVTLVCMLNLIPVFVVGKPGSGKTLALQLIYSNLRGLESRDVYFQKLPRMYMLSYQGSQSSTSEGILKVFEKAYRCKRDNQDRDVLVVVVLDEVGLAEVSSHNPLKVLHALLEPDGKQQVAVVGISNWSLDAAKMNRAIHLSQPDPSEDDLFLTSRAILESYGNNSSSSGSGGSHQSSTVLHKEQELQSLARAYYNYNCVQSQPNFHGLRDFYSLIKALRITRHNNNNAPLRQRLSQGLGMAVWRNFGGSPNDIDTFSQILKENLGHESLLQKPPSVVDLVKENFHDKDARHLMLITTGDSAISILEHMPEFQENVVVIHGSKYKDDHSDDYSYLMLSNIILHMEAGRCILLWGVEQLWSSLYDMLNQHYTTVAGRRNCRIAMGAYSNPMCFVHDNFRCIVVVDFCQIPRLDPPFLNRFEKQVLTYESILTELQKKAVKTLESWVEKMACLSPIDDAEPGQSTTTPFRKCDLFAGYHDDTLPSLVLHHMSAQEVESSASSVPMWLLDRCKEDLLRTAYVDGMVRASQSQQCQQEVADLRKWTQVFFGQWHDKLCLHDFLDAHLQNDDTLEKDLKVVITTRSNIHTPVKYLLHGLQNVNNVQIEKLGEFSSERQLQLQIQQFWFGVSNLLILQADALSDKEHIPLAKFWVDKINTESTLAAQTSSSIMGSGSFMNKKKKKKKKKKNVVLIIHTHRDVVQSWSGFTFLSGWQQLTLDQLQREETDLRVFLDHTIVELVELERIPLFEMMVKVLTWSFLCIKYPCGLNAAKYSQEAVQRICADKQLWGCFKQCAVTWLTENSNPSWQALVACNRGRLSLSSSLQDAFLHYIEEELREPIARLVYMLEKASALASYFTLDEERQHLCQKALESSACIFKLENVPAPRHPEGYHIKAPLRLSLPFSSIFAQHIDDGFQELYSMEISNGLKAVEMMAAVSDTRVGTGIRTSQPSEEIFCMQHLDKKKKIVEEEEDHMTARGSRIANIQTRIRTDISSALRASLGSIFDYIESNIEEYIVDFSKIYAVYKSDERRESEARPFEWVLRGNLCVTTLSAADLHFLLWEKGEKISAQALLAESCLSEFDLKAELQCLKDRKFPIMTTAEFDAHLVSCCCVTILPTRETVSDNLRFGAWFRDLNLLIKLASPLGRSTHWTTLVMLEVLRDMACLVMPPVSWSNVILVDLAQWFQNHRYVVGTYYFSPGELLEAVLGFIQEMNTLAEEEEEEGVTSSRECWFRFLALFLEKILDSDDLTAKDINTISTFLFQLSNPTCAMKGVMLKLLHMTQLHMSQQPIRNAHCPPCMHVFFDQKDTDFWIINKTTSFESEDHKIFVLLCDSVSDMIQPSVSRIVRQGSYTTEWAYKDFEWYLLLAIEELKSANRPLSLRTVGSLALLRSTLHVIADELITVHKEAVHSSRQIQVPQVVVTLAKELLHSSSPKVAALKQYLFKVLHTCHGLTVQEINILVNNCKGKGNRGGLDWYTSILEWDLMQLGADNPLGFDPFWSSSQEFQKAGERIWSLGTRSAQQESKAARRSIENATEGEQNAFTATVASRIFLVQAARKLTSREQDIAMSLNNMNLLRMWHPKWRKAIFCFADLRSSSSTTSTITQQQMGLRPNMPPQELWFKSLSAHVLLVVTSLPNTSPLQGYLSHDPVHLNSAFVLAAPDSSLAAFRTIVEGGRKLLEFQCPCGFKYFIGECGKPMQSGTCPNCRHMIGGQNHTAADGNVMTPNTQIQSGYVIDNIARSDTFYTVRHLDHKSFRALRVVMHYCLLVGLYLGNSSGESLARSMGLSANKSEVIEELKKIIQEDLEKLDHLLSSKREVTVKYMHSLISSLGLMTNSNILTTTLARDHWEVEFLRLFDMVKFESAHLAAAMYLQEQQATDRFAEVLEERGQPLFPAAIEALLRITIQPSLENFKVVYLQDSQRVQAQPLIRVFFNHEKTLGDLQCLMVLLRFSNAVHEKLSFRITRPDATSKTMRNFLGDNRELERLFHNFAEAWNSICGKVKGYGCREFQIPVMDIETSLALCLVEPRDQGIYITAILDYLANLQNSFIEDALALGTGANPETPDSESTTRELARPPTVHLQSCKVGEVIHYDRKWVEDMVCNVAMADLRYSHGLEAHYDTVTINQQLSLHLVQGKAHLEANWLEFPYKHEAFHHHATTLSDVTAAIHQESLRPETLKTIRDEIGIGGAGVGHFLGILDLCLGFLRRTGGKPSEPLGSYCERWLGKKEAILITENSVFDKIQLCHIVSLYEGLEDHASTCASSIVSPRYRSPLSQNLVREVCEAIKSDDGWTDKAETDEKLPASIFQNVLQRFMFRYLGAEHLRPNVALELYLTDPRLVRWPNDMVDESLLDDVFPKNLLLEHSYATYMLLSQMCVGADWKRVGLAEGWLVAEHRTTN